MGFAGTGKIWMNGSLVDWADAKIHIASHVIHYGSGVFEGARCYDTDRGPACFRLDAHMRRLLDSAKIYRMEYSLSQEQMENAVLDTIRANQYRACYIRPLIYRGYDTLGVNPLPCPVEATIMLWEWGAYLGEESITRGVDVCVSSWSRSAPNTLPALAKSTANYANAGLIKMEAVVNGYSEAIALDPDGTVSEGSGQNLFIVRENTLYTPAVASSILPGITRNSVLTIARDLGFTVIEQAIPREMLYIADELFFVGTAVEVTPIRSVDKIVIGKGSRGPITEAIQRSFFDIVNGRVPDENEWLRPVYTDEDANNCPKRTTAKTAHWGPRLHRETTAMYGEDLSIDEGKWNHKGIVTPNLILKWRGTIEYKKLLIEQWSTFNPSGEHRVPSRTPTDPYTLGMNLLARRELSEMQLRERFRKRKFETQAIETALESLRREGALDDRRTAFAYARTSVRLTVRGRRRILQEIVARGIDDETAREAVDAAFADVDEAEVLSRALAKRLDGPIRDAAHLRRLHRSLRQQGFPTSLIIPALAAHPTNIEEWV